MIIESDDPTYLDRVNDLTLSDMYKYQLVNVFSFLVDSGKINYYYGGRLHSNDYVNEILFMCLISNKLDKLNVFDFNDIGFADKKEWKNEMLDAFVNDERVSDETRKYVLTTHCRTLKGRHVADGVNTGSNHRYGNWQDMYPIFLESFARSQKWGWVSTIIDIAESIDEPAVKMYKESNRANYNRYSYSYSTFTDREHCIQVMAISKKTLEILLEEKEYELLDRANHINGLIGRETIDERTIELVKMKNASDISLKDRLVYEFTHDGILDYKTLLESKTVDVEGHNKKEDREGYLECLLNQYKNLYREIIMENPISYIELTYHCVKEENMSQLFKFAVDNNLKQLVDAMMSGNNLNIIRMAKELLVYSDEKKIVYGSNISNKIGDDWANSSMKKYRDGLLYVEHVSMIPNDVDEAIEFFNKDKETKYNKWIAEIEGSISRLVLKKENQELYEKYKREITTPYLMDLIEKGNEEYAIIRLCVRLAIILKYKYDYNDDLFNMLELFFAGPLKEYPNSEEWEKHLSHLRMKRNSLGHPMNDVEFSTEELIECIRIVEKIDS